MAVEAPYSKHNKTNYILYAVILFVLAGWCAYDGYYSEKWIQEHTNPDGSPQPYLTFNRQAPYYFTVGAVVCLVLLFVNRNKKVVAGESELIINDKEKIPYDSIEKIDKTHFASKGYFIVTYKGESGGERTKKLSYKRYDNLKAVLEHLVEEIS